MIICADDFGLRRDVDEAIEELCGVGRLSAVSCLVALERCDAAQCRSLRRHEAKVDLGLHLCLTDEGLPQESQLAPAATGIPALLRRALSGGTTPTGMAREVALQYAVFVEKFGRPPDFIDGHLHVHQLPVIREGLLEFVATLETAPRPYVRNTAARAGRLIAAGLPWRKAALIGKIGRTNEQLLRGRRIPTNTGFSGIYDFAKWRRFPEYLPRFVRFAAEVNSILVVHPGREEPWRRQEFETLREFVPGSGQINRFQRA